ncbi:DUF4097 family beta strand repeat-containing protein [Marinactinospora thermotolerans]|uniref:Putative adhesin n=1 Tax=Marinactinospora thermotolerans DSM 45154 TaxID=1122192 RepID=A0A1T4TFA7_9ACTN|nr:DUF4097 family beta strand repeat-containing protein [Marinactinospora thermotolerans]SKA39116.1 Putative adhesin [Marinactinospora thermotolerans DSM 45154]
MSNVTGRAATVVRGGAIALTMSLGASALAGCGAEPAEIHEEIRDDSYADVTKLHLTNKNGSTTIVGADVTEVQVIRTLTHRGDHPPTESITEGSGGRLEIRGEGCPHREARFDPHWCEIDYTVTVPYGTSVEVVSSDGDITLDDPRGKVVADASDGDLRLAGETEGAEIVTSDGDVDIDVVRSSEIEVTSRDGDVDVTLDAEFSRLAVSTNDGNVTVRTPADGGPYAVTATGSDGAVDIGVPHDPDARASIEIDSADGSITVQGS